jgi:cobalamin biosynthesis protein CobD/CbiB
MFKRRLYFLFPDTATAQRAVADLAALGAERVRIHALAHPRVDLSGLPAASERQRRDALAQIERRVWGCNLLVFALAFAGLITAAVFESLVGALAALAVMLACFAGGAWFALRLPDTHLNEFRAALGHGEILLLVDVARDDVAGIEDLMQRLHPESIPGGSSWTLDAFGV